MNLDRKVFHKSEYEKYTIDELAVLIDQMASAPARYTPEACDALKEVLIERNLDAQTLLQSLHANEFKDLQVALTKEQRRIACSKKYSLRLGRGIGLLGIPLSIGAAGLSLAQAHVGGFVASIAWFGCSVWAAFYYKGD